MKTMALIAVVVSGMVMAANVAQAGSTNMAGVLVVAD